jgi:endonuclease-3 related protein
MGETEAANLLTIHETLTGHLSGDSSWPEQNWPIRRQFKPPPFEIAVGAVLTQNTRWERVESALDRMSANGLNSPESILDSSLETVQAAIRTTGFYRNKAQTLRRLSRFLNHWPQAECPPSRKALLEIKGIGPETADAIRLYVFDCAEMIADNYTRRFLGRLGLVSDVEGYHSVKKYLEKWLPRNTRLYRPFHAQLVQFCKETCRKKPSCHRCPLRERCRFNTLTESSSSRSH